MKPSISSASALAFVAALALAACDRGTEPPPITGGTSTNPPATAPSDSAAGTPAPGTGGTADMPADSAGTPTGDTATGTGSSPGTDAAGGADAAAGADSTDPERPRSQ